MGASTNNQKEISISKYSTRLLLLSLIKIKEIKSFLQKYEENIENDECKILKTLLNLNKSTKLINDHIMLFKKYFKDSNTDIRSFYETLLTKLNDEIRKITGNNNRENKIMELVFFKINKVCEECKNPPEGCYLLMNNNLFLKKGRFPCELTCDKCKTKKKHMITVEQFPKYIIFFNEYLKLDSDDDTKMKTEYEIISFINSEKLIYKSYENWYQYKYKNNTYKKVPEEEIEANSSKNPIVLIFKRKKGLDLDYNGQEITKFFQNKNYVSAIMNYKLIKSCDNFPPNMFLVNKEYFDYLLLMNDIDLSSHESNKIEIELKKNKEEILNMNKLIVYDDPYKIFGDVDFVSEEILINLGYEKEKYLGKNLKLFKKIMKNGYQFILNNVKMRLVFKNEGQILSLCGSENINYTTIEKNSLINSNITKNIPYKNESNNNYNNSISDSNSNRLDYISTKSDNNNDNINNNINTGNQSTQNEENKIETKIKKKLNTFKSYIADLFNEMEKIKRKVNNNIENENQFEEYFIMNKKWFNRLTKILESDEVFNNEDITFDNILNIQDINSLDGENLKNVSNIFDVRIKTLNDVNLLNVEYGEIEIGKEKIKFPTNFMIIKKDYLNNLFEKCEIKLKYKLDKFNQEYKMILGEGYIFIQDNINSKIIFFCYTSNDYFAFNSEIMFQYSINNKFQTDIKKYIKGKGVNNYLNERNIKLNQKIQEIFDKEDVVMGKCAILINSNNCIKVLFRALNNIKQFNSYFQNYPINHINNNNLSTLFQLFTNNYNINIIQENRIILIAENKLREISNTNNLNNINFEKLINHILSTIDSELNTKKKEEIINIEDFDQTFAFRRFKQSIDNNNDSIIYKLFYGIKKLISSFQKCQIDSYNYEIFKYIYFKIEDKNQTDIISLIKEEENKSKNSKGHCNYCDQKDEDKIDHEEFYQYPEILIIILENQKNIKMKPYLFMQLKENNYHLISSIMKSKDGKDFQLLSKQDMNYFIIDDYEKKQIMQDDVEELVSKSFILFYENKNTQNKKNNNELSIIKEETELHDTLNMINANKNSIQLNIEKNKKENDGSNMIMNQNVNNSNIQNMNNQNNMNNMININQNNSMNNINQNSNKGQNINNINIPQNFSNNMNNMSPINNMSQSNMNNMSQSNMNNMNQSNMNIMNQSNMNNNMNQSNMNIMNQSNMNNMNQSNMNIMNKSNMNMIQNNMQMNNKNMIINQNNIQMNNMNMNPNQMMNFNQMSPNNNQMLMNNFQNNNQFMNPNSNKGNFQNGFNNFNNNMNNRFSNPMNNQFNNNNQMNPQFNNNQMNQQFNNNMNNQFNNKMNNQFNNNQMNNQFNNQFNNNQFNNNQMNNQFNNQMNNQFNNNQNNFNINNNNGQMINGNQNPISKSFNINFQNNMQIMPGQINNTGPIPKTFNFNNSNNNNNQNNFNNGNQINNNNQNNFNNNNDNINEANSNENSSENLEEQTNNFTEIARDKITLYFDFKNGKQIYLDVKKEIKFDEAIKQLMEKYEWLKKIKIKMFIHRKNVVDVNKTVDENGIKDSSKISIIEY